MVKNSYFRRSHSLCAPSDSSYLLPIETTTTKMRAERIVLTGLFKDPLSSLTNVSSVAPLRPVCRQPHKDIFSSHESSSFSLCKKFHKIFFSRLFSRLDIYPPQHSIGPISLLHAILLFTLHNISLGFD